MTALLVSALVGVVGLGILLWLETRKRKDAEREARDWKAEAALEKTAHKGLSTILEKRNEAIAELRSKLSVRDRFTRLFDPPETD